MAPESASSASPSIPATYGTRRFGDLRTSPFAVSYARPVRRRYASTFVQYGLTLTGRSKAGGSW